VSPHNRTVGALASLAFMGAVASCNEGDPGLLGEDEPIRLRLASFHAGELPGDPPLAPEAIAAGTPLAGSHVTIVETRSSVLRPGQAAKSLSGRATDDAVALGVQLKGEGTGHWVVPLGPADPATPGELIWAISMDVAHDAPAGLHTLLFAALDAQGGAGTQFAVPVCVTDDTPDNLHACDPTIAAPALVFSLEWDTDVDLDLRIVTPSGKLVDPKHPTTALPNEEGEVEPQEVDGIFDHDALSACNPVGGHRENLVFQQKPAAGVYYLFVGMFDACGQPAARFHASIEAANTDPPGPLVEQFAISGAVTAAQVDAGETFGLFVTEILVQ
jgi:hypothetical protein